MRYIPLALLTAMCSGVVIQAQIAVPVRIAAFAMKLNEQGGTRAGTLGIQIDAWSTDAQRDALTKTFLDQGPQRLLDAVRDAKPVGRIKGVETASWQIRFARQNALPGGETQILLLTERPMDLDGGGTQPSGYPFTLIDLRISKDGSGVGKASVATKLAYNKATNAVELANYAGEPVRISGVKIER
jgi:hypothetical protein